MACVIVWPQLITPAPQSLTQQSFKLNTAKFWDTAIFMLYVLLESVNLMLLKLVGAIGDLEDYLSKANWVAMQSRHLREVVNLIW